MAKRLLTRKRADWAKNRDDITFKGTALRGNAGVERRYVSDLERITNAMVSKVSKEIRKFYATEEAAKYFAMDATVGSQARILLNDLENEFNKLFSERAKPYSEKMIRGSANESKSALHSSLERLSGGLSIKTDIVNNELREITKATIAENVDLIKTIPGQYFSQVRGAVMRSIAQPNQGGLAELTENINQMLNKRAKQIRNKAKNLALDQTRKAYNNINAARMKDVGITQFEWVHSGGGQKPRPLHKDVLNGNIYSFDDLPIIEESTGERGIPGQAINCKCTMAPVLELNGA
jgi:SPP1 gp7 family putative phage head morphogenesis protein